ncbi:MAG: glutamate---methylamine ligase, partial [Acidobacteriaceae bacterium]|nr:glutamate---methylamine ligase [Acidobacteriaceae bacterium]
MTNDLNTLVREKGIEYFLCSFVEMSGIPKAKLVPATALDDMVTDGAGFAGFAAGDVGQGPHDPDLVSIPDMNAMIVLPWRKNIAWVPGMLQVENQPSKYCPRRILAHQLDIGR